MNAPKPLSDQPFDAPIRCRGVRVHNLQNIDIDIPRNQLVAFCGVSGSGKTSLALDTLYAEGQRRYIESFSAYTRQFLQQFDKPDADAIEGLPPTIAVTKVGVARGNRSTVATTTEIADHLRLVFAHAATLFCKSCGAPVRVDHPEDIAARFTRQPDDSGDGGRMMITFPIAWSDMEDLAIRLSGLQARGFVRLIVGDSTFNLGDENRQQLADAIVGAHAEKNDDAKAVRRVIETHAMVVVDRLTSSSGADRMSESLQTAMGESDGIAMVLHSAVAQLDTTKDTKQMSIDGRDWFVHRYSRQRRCEACEIDYPDPDPRLFSFNHALGACPTCEGFGDQVDVDMDLVVPDKTVSLRDGAIAPWNSPAYKHELRELLRLARDYDLPVDIPFKKLKKRHLKLIQHGVPERDFGGLDGFFAWLERKKYKMHVRVFLSRYRSYNRCVACAGRRFNDTALSYRLVDQRGGQHSIADIMDARIDHAADLFDPEGPLALSQHQRRITKEPMRQVVSRLKYLHQVGLQYLTLGRPLRTLSGGESQRVSLTTTLGSDLVNMLYVLDEPTAGLHPADTPPLCEAILVLRDRGNTVVVVEHLAQILFMSDTLVEIGPAAGTGGGNIVYQGTPAALVQNADSLTGRYLATESEAMADQERRTKTKRTKAKKNAGRKQTDKKDT
ncbi:MAG: excinuclease ABC subunit A, partial [Planctomycetota bacterium]